MSSNEDYRDQQHQKVKKRKIQRPCDVCRRKKIRCDGGEMPEEKCSNCSTYNFHCTYVGAAMKRWHPKGYVESLENRVEKLDKLLKRLCPDSATYKAFLASLDNNNDLSTFKEEHTHPTPSPPPPLVTSVEKGQAFLETLTAPFRHRLTSDEEPFYNDGDEDDETSLVLSDTITKLNLDGEEYRFFGKSSGVMLIQRAIRIKSEYNGEGLQRAVMQSRRSEFWSAPPWEKSVPEPSPNMRYIYPDQELAVHLIDNYFEHVNLYLPLLHRPSFEKDIGAGLHLKNASFAQVYLLVCALGSKWSDDRRVLPDGEDSWLASGWKWFHQVEIAKKGYLAAPTLYDIQFYCLCVQYIHGSSAPQATWTVVGIGIRLAQDVGAHRRKMKQYTYTAEDEMLKRAFWVLVCLDRMISAALGRPCAIQDEDFDLDLPIDCDDEYWNHPDPRKRFKQPPKKPSKITAFILFLKLNQVLAFTLRTIYSTNEPKILLGFIGHHWEQYIVSELDSALNQWVDSIPDHLRWDPNREKHDFFKQSVMLYSTYYYIQILIHKPFIPSPSRSSPLAFPSLAICTNAARSASHVIDVLRQRNFFPPPQVHVPAFTAAIVLLLNIWGGKRSGIYTNPKKEMEDVYKCMDVLRQAEQRWQSVGRLWDVMYELASVGDLPLPEHFSHTNNKKERDLESPISSNDGQALAASAPPSAATTESGNRSLAGSKRSGKATASASASVLASTTRSESGQTVSAPASTPASAPLTIPALAMQIIDSVPDTVASASSLSTSSQPMSFTSTPQAACMGISPAASEIKHQQVPQQYALPVYSDELGSLPVHGKLSFTSNRAHTHVHSHGLHASGSGIGGVGIGGIGMSGRTQSYSTLDHMFQIWAQQQAAAASSTAVGGAHPSSGPANMPRLRNPQHHRQQRAYTHVYGVEDIDGLFPTTGLSDMSSMKIQSSSADRRATAVGAGGTSAVSGGTIGPPEMDADGFAAGMLDDTMAYTHAGNSWLFPWDISSGIGISSSASFGLGGVDGLGGGPGSRPIQLDATTDAIYGCHEPGGYQHSHSHPVAAIRQAQAQGQPDVYTAMHHYLSSQPGGVLSPEMGGAAPLSSTGASGSGGPPQMTLEDLLNCGYVDNEMMEMWSAPFEFPVDWPNGEFLTNPGPR